MVCHRDSVCDRRGGGFDGAFVAAYAIDSLLYRDFPEKMDTRFRRH